jgi:hypothetical protein
MMSASASFSICNNMRALQSSFCEATLRSFQAWQKIGNVPGCKNGSLFILITICNKQQYNDDYHGCVRCFRVAIIDQSKEACEIFLFKTNLKLTQMYVQVYLVVLKPQTMQ